MPVRPSTDDERRALEAAQQPQPTAPDAATYGPGKGQATYRGQDIAEETPDDDHHWP